MKNVPFEYDLLNEIIVVDCGLSLIDSVYEQIKYKFGITIENVEKLAKTINDSLYELEISSILRNEVIYNYNYIIEISNHVYNKLGVN